MGLEPSFPEVIRDAIEARLVDLHTATVGRVVTYDPIRQVADIELVIRRPLELADGEIAHETPPVLPNVPVAQPRAGGFFLHLPLAKGDHVLVVFLETSIALWRATGGNSIPGDLRMHNLSHAVAIPGVAPALAALLDPPLPGMSTTEAVLGGGVYRVGSQLTAGFVALAAKVDALFQALATAVPVAGDGGAALKAALVAALATPAVGGSVAATKLKTD